MDNGIYDFYNENKKFKDYVDRYCVKHKIDVKIALKHIIVIETAKLYSFKEKYIGG